MLIHRYLKTSGHGNVSVGLIELAVKYAIISVTGVLSSFVAMVLIGAFHFNESVYLDATISSMCMVVIHYRYTPCYECVCVGVIALCRTFGPLKAVSVVTEKQTRSKRGMFADWYFSDASTEDASELPSLCLGSKMSLENHIESRRAASHRHGNSTRGTNGGCSVVDSTATANDVGASENHNNSGSEEDDEEESNRNPKLDEDDTQLKDAPVTIT